MAKQFRVVKYCNLTRWMWGSSCFLDAENIKMIAIGRYVELHMAELSKKECSPWFSTVHKPGIFCTKVQGRHLIFFVWLKIWFLEWWIMNIQMGQLRPFYWQLLAFLPFTMWFENPATKPRSLTEPPLLELWQTQRSSIRKCPSLTMSDFQS